MVWGGKCNSLKNSLHSRHGGGCYYVWKKNNSCLVCVCIFLACVRSEGTELTTLSLSKGKEMSRCCEVTYNWQFGFWFTMSQQFVCPQVVFKTPAVKHGTGNIVTPIVWNIFSTTYMKMHNIAVLSSFAAFFLDCCGPKCQILGQLLFKIAIKVAMFCFFVVMKLQEMVKIAKKFFSVLLKK